MIRGPGKTVVSHGDEGDHVADLDAQLDQLEASAVLSGCRVIRLSVEDPPPIDLVSELAAALASPREAPPLNVLAQGCHSVVIITSDGTRATPSHAMMGPVMEELARGGISPDAVRVVIGVGVHRPATPGEIVDLLGAEWAARLTVSSHDACAADLVEVGRTGHGTPVLLNRLVAQADLRIAFGQVEPHEFAGFTGGRKAILPAVVGCETIVRNHALEMLRSPSARPGVLTRNPIHEDMLSAARLAGLHFIVNVALDRDLRPIAVAAGDMEAAHDYLVAFLRRHLELSAPASSPAVIVTGPGRPLDINLYQTVKALVGIEPLLDVDYGLAAHPVVVLLSRCWDGTGSEEMFEPFCAAEGSDARAPGAGKSSGKHALSELALAALEHDFSIEKDESYYIARVTPKCSRVVAWCPGVSDRRLTTLGWEPAKDASSALSQALDVSRGADTGWTEGPAEPPLVLLCPRPQRALFVPPDA